MIPKMILQPGTVLILETGEYSSTKFDGPFLVLQAIDTEASVKFYREQWKPIAAEEAWKEEPDEEDYIVWLFKQNAIEPLKDCFVWHVDFSIWATEATSTIQPTADKWEETMQTWERGY